MSRYSVKEKVTPQVFDSVDFDQPVGGAERIAVYSHFRNQLILYSSCTIS